jgi:hypothetical protein
MCQKGYRPKGWLGLILGTRLWHGMWDGDKDDDAAFERRLDPVVRELGDRGKRQRATATAGTPSPAPALASVRAPAPAPTVVAPALVPLDSSQLALERDELRRQVQQMSSQLASAEVSPGASSHHLNLSEAFYLERERVAERQAERDRVERVERAERVERVERAERERAERSEARLVGALSVGMCACGLGVASIGVALLLKKN